jgi:hypothetical protein
VGVGVRVGEGECGRVGFTLITIQPSESLCALSPSGSRGARFESEHALASERSPCRV